MIIDSVIGLAVAVIVISSVAWVSQYRKIRDRIRVKKAVRERKQQRPSRLILRRWPRTTLWPISRKTQASTKP